MRAQYHAPEELQVGCWDGAQEPGEGSGTMGGSPDHVILTGTILSVTMALVLGQPSCDHEITSEMEKPTC